MQGSKKGSNVQTGEKADEKGVQTMQFLIVFCAILHRTRSSITKLVIKLKRLGITGLLMNMKVKFFSHVLRSKIINTENIKKQYIYKKGEFSKQYHCGLWGRRVQRVGRAPGDGRHHSFFVF